MHHLTLMSIVKRGRNGREQAHNLVRGRTLSLTRGSVEIVSQGRTFHVIHYQIGFAPALRHIEIMDLDNIGMVQGSKCLCLTIEARSEISAGLCINRQNFNGDIAMLLGIKSLPDLASTTSYTLLQLIFPKAALIHAHSGAPRCSSSR